MNSKFIEQVFSQPLRKILWVYSFMENDVHTFCSEYAYFGFGRWISNAKMGDKNGDMEICYSDIERERIKKSVSV